MHAATLAISPDVMDAWFGVPFERGRDARDDYRAAGVQLPSGRRVLLWWYERAPEPRGLTIIAAPDDDACAACDETLTVLGLCERDVMSRERRRSTAAIRSGDQERRSTAA